MSFLYLKFIILEHYGIYYTINSFSLTPSADVELLLVVRPPGERHRRHVGQDPPLYEHPQEHGRLAVLNQGVERGAQYGLEGNMFERHYQHVHIPFFVRKNVLGIRESFFIFRSVAVASCLTFSMKA